VPNIKNNVETAAKQPNLIKTPENIYFLHFPLLSLNFDFVLVFLAS